RLCPRGPSRSARHASSRSSHYVLDVAAGLAVGGIAVTLVDVARNAVGYTARWTPAANSRSEIRDSRVDAEQAASAWGRRPTRHALPSSVKQFPVGALAGRFASLQVDTLSSRYSLGRAQPQRRRLDVQRDPSRRRRPPLASRSA